MPEKVIGVDVPLLTSMCFCYLGLRCSGHEKTFTLQTAVTTEDLTLLLWLVTALLLEGGCSPLYVRAEGIVPYPLQARSVE